MTTIIVTHEDNEVDEFEFDADTPAIGIGRRSTNDVCIPNLSVSGMHARITVADDGAWIEDLNSTNGTYINGRLISRQRLNEDDEIIIGKTRVAYLATTTVSAPVPTVEVEQRQERSLNTSQASVAESAPRQTADALSDLDADDSYGDFSDVGDDLSEDEPMSLSEKAKLALGRPATPKPRLKAIAGSAAVAGAAVTAHDAMQRSAITNAAEDVVSSVETSAATIGETVNATGHSADAHPLDGIERMPTADEIAEFDDKPSIELDESAAARNTAVIEIKNGAKSGQILPIDKPVTTLGRPGIQIAAIMRKPDGYFVMHIESDDSAARPTLNRDAIGDEPVLLHSGDELNVAGIDVEFMFS